MGVGFHVASMVPADGAVVLFIVLGLSGSLGGLGRASPSTSVATGVGTVASAASGCWLVWCV